MYLGRGQGVQPDRCLACYAKYVNAFRVCFFVQDWNDVNWFAIMHVFLIYTGVQGHLSLMELGRLFGRIFPIFLCHPVPSHEGMDGTL